MCNLYTLKATVAEMRGVFEAANQPNFPVFGEIYPNREAPVVTAGETARELALMTWGFPPPASANRPVTNVRNLSSPFWRTALSKPERRCLVPVNAFSEWAAEPDPATGRKRKVWFEVKNEPLFAFAGIWRPMEDEPPRYAFLTTEANEIVGAVHPKAMPVILAREDYNQWLRGDYPEATALAKPFPSDAMRIVT